MVKFFKDHSTFCVWISIFEIFDRISSQSRSKVKEEKLTCMRLAAWLVLARMTPHMPSPAMTPPEFVPAHAAKMKMQSLPYCNKINK